MHAQVCCAARRALFMSRGRARSFQFVKQNQPPRSLACCPCCAPTLPDHQVSPSCAMRRAAASTPVGVAGSGDDAAPCSSHGVVLLVQSTARTLALRRVQGQRALACTLWEHASIDACTPRTRHATHRHTVHLVHPAAPSAPHPAAPSPRHRVPPHRRSFAAALWRGRHRSFTTCGASA